MSESKQTLIVDCDGVIADKASLGDYGNAAPLPFGVQQINNFTTWVTTSYSIQPGMEIEKAATSINNMVEVI